MTPPARRTVLLLLLAFATLAHTTSGLLIRATNNCDAPADVIIQFAMKEPGCDGFTATDDDGDPWCNIEMLVQPGDTDEVDHDTSDLAGEDNCIFFTGKGAFSDAQQ